MIHKSQDVKFGGHREELCLWWGRQKKTISCMSCVIKHGMVQHRCEWLEENSDPKWYTNCRTSVVTMSLPCSSWRMCINVAVISVFILFLWCPGRHYWGSYQLQFYCSIIKKYKNLFFAPKTYKIVKNILKRSYAKWGFGA